MLLHDKVSRYIPGFCAEKRLRLTVFTAAPRTDWLVVLFSSLEKPLTEGDAVAFSIDQTLFDDVVLDGDNKLIGKPALGSKFLLGNNFLLSDEEESCCNCSNFFFRNRFSAKSELKHDKHIYGNIKLRLPPSAKILAL